MYIFLRQEDRDRLMRMADELGISMPYHYFSHGQQNYVLSSDGQLTSVPPDTYIVDLLEKFDERLKALEEKVGP